MPEMPKKKDDGGVETEEDMAMENPMPFQQSVLSVDLYLDIEKDRRGGVSLS